MVQILWEIFIVFLLTLLNGFFSCAEIALISVRKTRIASLVEQGNKRAKIIQQLHKNPESLFATIQVGISVITIFASAFAGANIAQQLSVYLGKAGNNFIAHNAYAISFILVVAFVSYLSLILGELVPKSLGLRYAENFGLIAAYPIWWLSKISAWLIKILSFSSNLILRPFKDKTNFTEHRLSEDEIRLLLAEGQRVGAIETDKHNILENVFEFSDLAVGKIMIPRTQIVAFNIDGLVEQTIKQAINSGYSRVPIYQSTLNNIVGILYTKKLLTTYGENSLPTKLQEFLVPPYFVPNTMKISEVLKRLQRKKVHMALVTDEHGEIEGLVTLEDVLEEIVGEITDETDETSKAVTKQEDGSFLVTGEMSVVDFNKYFKADLPEDADYSTVSGFILEKLGRFPDEGDKVIHKDFEFTVKERTQRTVKTAIVLNKGTKI